MFSATYLLADVAIRIESQYAEVQQMCAPYATQLPAEITVRTTPQEIVDEARLSDRAHQLEGLPPTEYRPDYLETLTIYRKIAEALLSRGVLLIHGSVVAVDGEAYMFTAKSGTGKSTHVALWRQLFGQRAVMVNDDKPLLRISPEGVTVYGTPWDGKHHLSNNISVPLRAFVVLRRGDQNQIRPASFVETYPILLQQTHYAPQVSTTNETLRLMAVMSEHVGFYELHCNMDPEAARVAYRGITGCDA